MEASTTPVPARHGARSAPRRLLAALMLIALAACGGNDDGATPASVANVAAVTVTLAVDHIAVGQTAVLGAEARDANGAVVAGASFTWTSSDGAVASVADGVATGVGAGAARITASSGGITSDPVTIAVVVVAKGSVVIDQASVFFTGAGQSRALSALAADAQGAAVSAPIVWISSAPDKVAVDATGRLTALAIGSAQITASAGGVTSAPTLVVVAEPQPGALLVSDAQVVAVGSPFVPPGAAPGAPLQYDVTLQGGAAAPAPGTVVLAAESAPIAGKVVATRVDGAGQLIVTLALAPLPQLFRAYDIDWTIDLSAFPAGPAPTVQVALGAAWNDARMSRSRARAVRPLDAVAPFKPFACDAEINGKIGERKATLSLDNKLKLVVHDKPGYSRHSLEGPVTLTGSASLKLNLGFEGSGKCEATAQIKLPVLGWFSVIAMPAVRLGLGAQISGEVLFAQGELGVDGSVGVDVVMGWECGGATPECRSLDSRTPSNKLETKSKFPSAHDMQVKVSGQFYVLAGFDAVFFLGAANAKIVEARAGPTQSFDLAFEGDQAIRPDYASHYELTLDAVIEPGSALKEAIKRVIDDDAVEVKFKLATSMPLSESPKGTFVADKTRVAIGAPIVFTVDLDPATVAYAVIGYNVTGLELYRRRDDEVEFTPWKAMTMVTELRGTYIWKPEAADAGNYEFAAFVNTQIQPLPWFEVGPNSIKKVEVSCFTAGALALVAGQPRMQVAAARRVGPQATTCADTWVGTTASGDAAYGPNQTEATLTLRVDDRVSGQGPGQVFYYAEGTLKVNRRVTDLNGVHCEWLPFEIVIDRNTGSNTPGHGGESNQFVVNYGDSLPTAGGSGVATGTQTIVCTSGTTSTTSTITNGYAFMSGPQVALDASGLSWGADHQPFYSFHFTRP